MFSNWAYVPKYAMEHCVMNPVRVWKYTPSIRYSSLSVKKAVQDHPKEFWWGAIDGVSLLKRTILFMITNAQMLKSMRNRWSISFQSSSRAMVHKKAKSPKQFSLQVNNTADLHGTLDNCLSKIAKLEGIVHPLHHRK